MSEKIKQNTARLRAVATDYQAEMARIDSDERASDAYKAQQREDAHARAVERAFVTAAQVWGQPRVDANFTRQLDESGHAWQEQAAAVAKLEQARQAARRSAIDPAWFAVAHARAQALVRQAQTGDELLSAYNTADPDVRAVLAEFGESLLVGESKTGREWLGAILRLNADARAVYDNPDYQSAYAQLEGVVDALADARKALHGVVSTLGTGGPVDGLRALLHGVEETKRDVLAPDGKLYALPAFERHVWGAVPVGDGGFIFTS